MSARRTIPTKGGRVYGAGNAEAGPSSAASASSTSPDSRLSASLREGKAAMSPASSTSSSPATPSPLATRAQEHARRPSLLSEAFAKEESNVINIGDPDGPPRLISYLTTSQGYQWNPEIFIPSYVDYDYEPLDHRREPVIDIILTDEEIAKMMPS